MSVAGQEACLLRTLLGRLTGDSNPIAAVLAPTFFAEVQTLIETPWAVATFDFCSGHRGQRPADFEIALKFGIALNRLAAEDPAVHKADC